MNLTELKVGDTAPDFKLKNQNGDEISLSSFRGKKVLISFHPLAWTPVCEIQMKSLEIKHDVLGKLNVVALGLSVDAQPCKLEWAKNIGIKKTDLLADFWPHGDVASKFGVFIEKAGISGRVNFLIDENGKLIFVRVYEKSEIPDIEEIVRFLQK
ncbi:MAG TPA: redoxin domain-containing protein [Spirochaetota bacterium]|nr:redoxin domain-containing protein [Spirochaetota bacterium]